MDSRFYIDCEFDGHGGELLSIAIVPEEGDGAHIRLVASLGPVDDPWVAENVIPHIRSHRASLDFLAIPYEVGPLLRLVIGEAERPIIIADSPVDIGRFCAAISTDVAGNWASTDYPQMTFEVHNVDCYPTALEGAVQHNAWWDAMALREKLRDSGSRSESEDSRSEAEAAGRQSGPNEDSGIAQTEPIPSQGTHSKESAT